MLNDSPSFLLAPGLSPRGTSGRSQEERPGVRFTPSLGLPMLGEPPVAPRCVRGEAG